ncbi:hypothetical protein HDV00_006228 [Rhizophlyctis rosea]|nr:hypothetical protein HDV00_006228 [Rhizophlyctis rosea]
MEDNRTATTIHHHSLRTLRNTIPIYAAPLEPLYTVSKRSTDGTAKPHQIAPAPTDPQLSNTASTTPDDHPFLPLFQNPRLTFLQTGKHPPSPQHQHPDPLPNLPPHLYAHNARTPSHTAEPPPQFAFPLLTPESPNQDQPVTLAGVLRYLGLMRAVLGRAEESGRPGAWVDGMGLDGDEEVVDLTGGVD